MDRILQFLSDYAIQLTNEKIPQEAVHQVKRLLIDSLGCAMGAYLADPSRIARSHALEVTANPGSTVLGTKHRTAPELAAFANGVMVRYLDFNDAGLGHPSDNIPAVLAAAEYAGVDTRTAITGIALAYEIHVRFGEAAPLDSRGWDHVTYTALASAAGAGKVMGLTHEKMANALALAATANTALRQVRLGNLSMWKGCAAANAGRNGVFAAQMAGHGLTGPDEAFEGAMGFLKQIAGPIELSPFGGNGRPFKVEKCAFKYFPAQHDTQCAIQPALEIRQVLGGRVDEIERIIVETYDQAVARAAGSPDKWNPRNRETADHSIPYVLAVAFVNGTVWLEDFKEDRLGDPQLVALMRRIEVRTNVEYTRAYPEANCFRIEVITRSGERHIRETRYARGHSSNPMTDLEIEAKFQKLAEPMLGPRRVNQILDRLWHVEEVQNLRELLALFEV